MSANHDQVFVRTFLVVLGLLVAFSFFIYFVAQVITDEPGKGTFVEEREARVRDHTQPAFQVVTDPNAVQQVAMTDTAGGGEPQSGSEVYSGLCAGCHDAGVAGAPKVGDAGLWESRMGDGIETLYKNAINGLNAMPAKGGDPSLSDDEVKAAVDHMLKESGVSVEGS